MSIQRLDIPLLFDSCVPRSDVFEGTLEEEQFAASLSAVAHTPDTAAAVYRDATEFFDTTYPTEGLQTLLSNLSGRILAAEGGDSHGYKSSILCLDTTFGGGKTHDLIAAYHLANSSEQIENLDRYLDDRNLAADYQRIADDLSVNTAVFVGGHVDARNARSNINDADAPNTNTMWGEIAYQLFGPEGYELIEAYDRDRQAPGQNTLKRLFDLDDDPSLVLIDEIAAYLQDASSFEVGDATLASQTVSFMLSLLETAAELESLTVIYSIADTAFAEEAEEVRKIVDELDQIGKRQQKVITPTGETEVGAVLQHRLFEEVDAEAGEKLADAYFQFYDEASRQLPQETTDDGYRDKLAREYPFHPSVIETLTEKIDTIPDFQRTRGALKLLGRAVHYLWNNRPEEYDRHFVRLYDLTPADDAPDGSIRSTLNESLFEFIDLDPAVKADIYNADGTAHAQLEDRKWTEKAYPPVASHVTTTVLWNSLAYGKQASGVSRSRLYEAVGHPEISFDNYDSALKNLAGEDMSVACYYLYDEDQIRFKAEPNLIRIIDQRVQNTPEEKAKHRFNARLEREIGSGAFNVEIFPEEPADVPDSATEPTLCVMHLHTAPVSDGGDAMPDKIQELYEKTASKHGGKVQNRSYKNYVLFLAPDQELVENAIEQATRLEAIEDLLDDSKKTADLSNDQIEELQERRDTTRGLLGESVRGVYRHLFYVGSDGLTHVTITSVDANGGSKLVDAVQRTLEDMNRIIKDDDPAKGPVWFEQKLWQRQKNRMTTEALAIQFARKPGLPYLLSTKTLRKTIARMVNEANYAYWDGEEKKIYWKGETQPENWPHSEPLPDSPSVVTESMSGSDVTISEDCALFTDIEALLEQHVDEIEPPETKCSDCGATVENPQGSAPHYCGDCDERERAECEDCSAEIPDKEPADEPVLCEECEGPGEDGPQPERWERTTDKMSAARTFTEVRDHAKSEARSGDVPGIDSLILELGGEDKFKHATFLASRPALKSREESVSVDMEYKTEAELGDGTARYTANFSGPLEAFTTLNQNPEGFSDRNGGKKIIDLRFSVDLEEPEPVDDDREDVLAELGDALEQLNVTVRARANGPLAVEEER